MTNAQIAAASMKAAEEVEPQLEDITAAVIKQHRLEHIKISQPDLVRIGLALNDIQRQSFNLGIRVGMKLLFTITVEETQNARVPDHSA